MEKFCMLGSWILTGEEPSQSWPKIAVFGWKRKSGRVTIG